MYSNDLYLNKGYIKTIETKTRNKGTVYESLIADSKTRQNQSNGLINSATKTLCK